MTDNIIYNVAKKVANHEISLPLDGTTYINNLRMLEHIEHVDSYHPIIVESKYLKGLIKATQN
jgi:hypothetical protein